MYVLCEKKDNGFYVSVNGRIDSDTAADFRKSISELDTDNKKITFDFRDVSYVSSAGLREIMICARRFKSENMNIINVNDDVYSIFEMTGFDSSLSIQKATGENPTYVRKTISRLVRDKVKESPDVVVLKGDHGEYTWRKIDQLSQIIADDLNKLGIKKGSHVGICGANSVNWVLTYYAVQKLGAIAMLINPTLQAVEIGQIVSLGDISVLCYGNLREMKDNKDTFLDVVKQSSDGKLQSFYAIDKTKDFDQRKAEYDLLVGKYEADSDYDMPCTVIFTSGSTGRPKGVILSPYNLLNNASIQLETQLLSSDDKNLLILPLFHIFGLSGCLLPCAMANAILYIPDDNRTDTMIRVMKNEHCTIMHSVPTLLIALLNNPNFDSETFSSLRLTAVGGAAATESQMKMFREKMPNNHFKSGYGLSEMTPVSATDYIDTEEHILYTVGKPSKNVRVMIVDPKTNKECKTGEKGEILAQGINLMMGYYKLPIEEQSIDENGWLHTGDLGYFDEEGYLHLSGRLKELIIRGGENIMPAVVEKAVSALDEVNNVKVIGVPSSFFGEEVCACIKLNDGAEFDEEKLKSKLDGNLAKHMIPSYFVVFDEFPLLGSGKIDAIHLKEEAMKRLSIG